MNLLEFILIQLNLGIFILFYVLFLSREGNWKANRYYLLLVPFMSVLLAFVPGWVSNSQETSWTFLLEQIQVFSGASSASEQPFINTRLIYLIFTGFFLVGTSAKLVLAIRSLKAKFYKDFRGVKVFLLEDARKPTFTFFNSIYLSPSDLAEEQPVLLHEYAHVKGGHSMDNVLMAFVVAVFWFNPLIYLLARKMRENHEYIADSYVLQHNYSVLQYGQTILSAAMKCSIPFMGSGFKGQSTIGKRIQRLQKCKPKYLINMKYLLIVPMLVGMAFMASCQKNQVVPPGGENQISDKSTGIEVDQPAEFPGGMDGLIGFMTSEIKYPKDVANAGITGKTVVTFTVTKDGKVANPAIASSSGNTQLDNEAIRVVAQMPNWIPAQDGGKNVSSELKLPVQFALED